MLQGEGGHSDSQDDPVVTPPEAVAAPLGFRVPRQGCVRVCSCGRSCSYSAWRGGGYEGVRGEARG